MVIDVLIIIAVILLAGAVGFIIARSGGVKKHNRDDKYQSGYDPQYDHHFDPAVKYHDDEKKK